MDRNLALEAVRVTEAAALSCARLAGRGDERAADQAAVDAMRRAFNALTIDGTIVIGEGERDEAPMLYIGEKVGGGGPRVDIALDPLEGTTICANGAPNALAVPWVTFVVVPLVLLGTALLWVSEPLATLLLHGAVEALAWIWIYLERLSDLDFATWHLPRPTPGVAASAAIGVPRRGSLAKRYRLTKPESRSSLCGCSAVADRHRLRQLDEVQ